MLAVSVFMLLFWPGFQRQTVKHPRGHDTPLQSKRRKQPWAYSKGTRKAKKRRRERLSASIADFLKYKESPS